MKNPQNGIKKTRSSSVSILIEERSAVTHSISDGLAKIAKNQVTS